MQFSTSKISFSTVSEWMKWINSLHTYQIDLGLDRVCEVASRLDLLTPKAVVITVAGTNGKGSTVAGLEAVYLAAGKKVGAFTSPYLFTINEQIRINHENVTDEMLCAAFACVADALLAVTLTPFEYITLAALLILKQHALDLWILEVGLGGRLDAVNIITANLAVITSIGLDHTQWLGETREQIGFEKAGIFRQQQLAVYGDPMLPLSVLAHAKKLGTKLYCLNQDYFFQENKDNWDWQGLGKNLSHLPKNSLYTQNMAAVVTVVQLLQPHLAVNQHAIEQGLCSAMVPGRIQIIPGEVTLVYDVAHNPDSVMLLAQRLQTLSYTGKTIAVFSMLADKDIITSIHAIAPLIDRWFVAPLNIARGASGEKLREVFHDIDAVEFYSAIEIAYCAAKEYAKAGDRIVIFGSFHTVSACYENP